MPLTAATIATNIVNQLRILDPTVSAEIGTPERKLIEATAEMIASQQVDFTVLNQQTDLSTLSGGRLDAYLSIFNFGRQQATPAYGFVTFSRNADALNQITIPRGTQVQANIDSSTFPSLVFVTTDTVVLDVNTTSVRVAVQCTVGGTIGNIDANKIVGFAGLQSIAGISTVTNPQAFAGGTDAESDDAYKVRFQNSFLRNISGTTDMFLALAVSLSGISKANVVGALSRYQEYVLIPAADDVAQHTWVGNNYDPIGASWPHKRTTALSTIPYSQYTYPLSSYVTNGTLDPSSALFFRAGVDFVFNTPPIDATIPSTQVTTTPTTSPNVTFLNPFAASNPTGNTDLTESTAVLFEHAYISANSRNNRAFGVLNCVDLFINGENLTQVSSTEAVPPTSHRLQNTNAAVWTYHNSPSTVNFVRKLDDTPSAVGSLIQPLYWQPVVELPDTISIGPDTYLQAHYWSPGDSTYYWDADLQFKAHFVFTEEQNSIHGTLRCRNGIEWFMAGNNYLPGRRDEDDNIYTGGHVDLHIGESFLLDGYTYDQNVSDLQAIIEKNKQTTQDALVHKSRVRYFQPIITLMYSIGVTQAVVNASIFAALSSFYANQYFGAAIQLSDILQTIHNVPGVDNVRWTHDAPSGHKVQEVAQNGNALSTPTFFITDFFIQDSELADSPRAAQAIITVRTQNTWGS